MHFSHLAAMALFALLVSLATGFLTQRTTVDRLKYTAISFTLFMLIGIAVAWLMFPFSK